MKLAKLIELINQNKSKIILISIILFSFHAFFLVFSLGVDFPISDEIDFIPFVKKFIDGGPWWQDSHFIQHYDHRQVFPPLILLVSSTFDSGNVVHQMYLGISFLVIAIGTLYYLLKKTDNDLVWLIIPISAVVLNAGQSGCYLWGACATSLFLVSVSVILTIFFISRIEKSKLSIIFAVIFSIVASFTNFYGLMIWVVGGFGLLFLKQRKKQALIIWTISATVTYITYFTNYIHGSWKGIQTDTLFTFEGIDYILQFLSNGLIVHLRQFHSIQITISIVIILIIIIVPIYLKSRKVEMNKITPWLQIGLFGLFGAILTELGRIGVVGAVASRYMAIAVFAQISFIVLGSMIFLYFYKKLKNKRQRMISKIFVFIIISVLILGISSSYYSGWKIGYDWFYENTIKYECLRDDVVQQKCPNIYSGEEQYNNLKLLKELQLSVFSEKGEKKIDSLLEDSSWNGMKLTEKGVGSIKYINNNPFVKAYFIPSESKIFVTREESPIDIGGFGVFLEKDIDVDSAYVFIDDHVNSKAHYGFLNQNSEIYGEKTKPSYFAGVGGVIDISKLSEGCHSVSIRFTHNNEYFIIKTESQICVN